MASTDLEKYLIKSLEQARTYEHKRHKRPNEKQLLADSIAVHIVDFLDKIQRALVAADLTLSLTHPYSFSTKNTHLHIPIGASPSITFITLYEPTEHEPEVAVGPHNQETYYPFIHGVELLVINLDNLMAEWQLFKLAVYVVILKGSLSYDVEENITTKLQELTNKKPINLATLHEYVYLENDETKTVFAEKFGIALAPIELAVLIQNFTGKTFSVETLLDTVVRSVEGYDYI